MMTFSLNFLGRARVAAIALALTIAACAHTDTAPAAAQSPTITILVSIDGFRPDYLSPEATPTLWRLAREGASAEMRPAFPSITFPNHYTLVTGVRPDTHGVVNNRMEDSARPGVTFTLSDRQVASDPIWWEGATPLWVDAERQGVRSATMFWPGSDYELGGVRPSHWRAFDQGLPDFARVDTLLGWVDAPERPLFFTLYFDIVDTAGHRYGPDAYETRAAAAQTDAALARLVDGLAARGVAANLVIVSDHGMAEVSEDRVIDLDALLAGAQARIVWDGPLAGLEPAAGADLSTLLGPHANGECLTKQDAAHRFGYGAHVRVPPVICLAAVGWRYRSSQIPPYRTPSRGAHGYDPNAPEMAALFIGHGPAFKSGLALPRFNSVSVYPLLAHLIGVTPAANEGALADTASALREPSR